MFEAFILFMTLVFGLLGLVIGSFLNVCVYRIPRGESVVIGRSHCPACGHVLSALDLVPIVSYLALNRRCRYCRAPISSRYAIVEVLTGILYASAGFAFTRIGLSYAWPARWIFLIPLLYIALLSLVWTWHLMQARQLKTSVSLALLVSAGQLLLPSLVQWVW